LQPALAFELPDLEFARKAEELSRLLPGQMVLAPWRRPRGLPIGRGVWHAPTLDPMSARVKFLACSNQGFIAGSIALESAMGSRFHRPWIANSGVWTEHPMTGCI
jgi:hypothetical protein